MASSERESLFNNERFDSEKRYDKLFSKGLSKGKAARVASSSGHQSGKHKQHPRYEKWTTDNLYQKATELGIEGCSGMSKHTLVSALRNY